MKTITTARGVIALLYLLTTAGLSQACFYEGDPVLTDSGYDVPQAVTDNDCYYGGDPVLESSGEYNSPVILSQGSYYYTADLPDSTIQMSDLLEISEFSAFEHEALIEDNILPDISEHRQALDDHEWIPQAWNMSY